jgi:hypothetical protein
MCYPKEVANVNDDEIFDGTLWEDGVIKAGDKIYVDSRYYLSRGVDYRIGGIATVSKVFLNLSGGKNVTFIETEAFPEIRYNWTHYLAKEQRNLKKEFGDKIAHADPDLNSEMNKGD